MKNMLHFFRQGIIILLLGSSLPSFSQSFQNTLLGINNDDYVAGVAVSKNYWIMGNTNSFTPSLGTEHMLFSKYNGNTGASIWDRKYYSATNTAIQFTATDLQAGYANFTTSPGNSVPPLPCNFTACSVFGPTVNKIGDPKSNKYFYVSGFWKDPVFGVRRLVVLKILTNGNIAWARTNVIAGAIYDEAGVSVESCPNGDVMVVSQVTNAAGQVYPAITRLSFNGTLLWRFFYQPATFEQPYNYIPHQSCIYREFLNGNVNDPIGIAITGECNQVGVPGSSFFVMRIAYNGGMIWKNCYPMVVPSGAVTFDTGWDIMVEDETLGGSGLVDNFVVTGLSNEFGAGPIAGALGFMSRVTTGAGAFVNCHRFGVPIFGAITQITYGQSIHQSPTAAQNVVIAGGTDDPANGINNDTYLLEMDITNGTLSFAQHYALTTPNFPRTESVVPVGSTFPTPGFLLSTNSFNTYGGGTNEDAHIIKTDVIGQVNAAACLSDTLKFKVDTVKANIKNLCTVQFCAITDSLKMKMKKVFPPHQLCFSATKEAEEVSSFSEKDELQITVAPNPSYGSEDIRLYLSAEVSGNYNVRIMNISGQVVKEVNGIFEEGDSDMSINTRDLSEGIYLITLFNGAESSTCKFVKLK